MSITTIRTSDTQVQVEHTVYTFAAKDDADAFQRCIASHSISTCYQRHPPAAVRSATLDERPDDPNRGSTISPSLRGMP
jgi:hypothetical protein